MYHLIRSLYLHATSKEEYSVLLLGLDNAGKTTLLNQVKNLYRTSAADNSAASIAGVDGNAHADGDEPAADLKAGNTVPTVGQNVAVINLPDMYIKIWDVGGQMTLRRLWTSYYKSCHAVIFVVDSSDLGTLDSDIDGMNEIEAADADHTQTAQTLKTPVSPGGEDGLGSMRGAVSKTGTIGRKWHGRRKSSYNVFAEEDVTGRSATNSSTAEDTTSAEDGKENNLPTTKAQNPQNSTDEKKSQTSRPTLNTTNTTTSSTLLSTSLSMQGRLDECRAVLESVLGHPDTTGIPILVLANKQDREDCIEVVRIKEGFVRKVFEGDKGGLVRDSRVLPVSALRGTGVREAVEWVRKRVVGNKLGRAPVMR